MPLGGRPAEFCVPGRVCGSSSSLRVCEQSRRVGFRLAKAPLPCADHRTHVEDCAQLAARLQGGCSLSERLCAVWDSHSGEIRFHVAGPLGAAYVHAQVPAKRRRGELRYVIVEDIRTRRLTYVVDNRMQEMEEANAKAAAAAAAAEAAAAKELPSTRAVE